MPLHVHPLLPVGSTRNVWTRGSPIHANESVAATGGGTVEPLLECTKGTKGSWTSRPHQESGFGKASDRVKAKEHRPYGILGGSVVGCPSVLHSVEGKKLDRCSKVIIGFPVSLPSALVKR